MAKRSSYAVSICLAIFCITCIQYCTATTYDYEDGNNLQSYFKYTLNTVYELYQNFLNFIYQQQDKIVKGHYWNDVNVPEHNIDDRVILFTWFIIGYLSMRLFSATAALMILSFTLICYMSFGPLWSKHMVWTATNEASKMSFVFDEIAARPLISAICVFILCCIKILYNKYRKYRKHTYLEESHHHICGLTESMESMRINHDRLMKSVNELHSKMDRILSIKGASSRRN